MIKCLFNKINNLIRFGYVTNISDDSAGIQVSQFKSYNKTSNLICIFPYGYSASPDLDALALIMNPGHEENAVAFPYSGPERNKNLKPGEIAIANPKTGTFIKYASNGDLEISSANDLNVNVEKNVNIIINGDSVIQTTGNATFNTEGNCNLNTTGETNIDSTGNINNIRS